ncbi:heme exporter protein CcmD [Shimia thalassica]|uniref:Heme exporter protein D n=1 Tax=Shimia thalassica TaxID=1715693 RepID=A0A0P1IB46_9RHOB|nr:heme exporter protein CcmD [Shimia thalassica]MBU2941818.1 heme exporter protein CcmD [Shimia thalassica]MDO6480913.1 heme exporter protein CcmD [Shimia thalassica]MDO6483608.1 heme exporter protein CcmD [Shimia thalassica]MDO6503802.1 heme exporter protein CcmD [Shimia thalassica]MDO6521249.1 heme exporter protein CcmD [Shimia thalassica]
MMPDLGKYADTVLSAYLVSIVLLVVLVAMSLRASRKARADLEQVETRRRG